MNTEHPNDDNSPEKIKQRGEEVILRRENYWLELPEREELLMRLDRLASQPDRSRERSMAIIAEANGGKSGILKRYQALHPSYELEDRTIVPSILIDVSSTARVEDLSIAMLAALGAVDPESGNHTSRLKRFIALSRTAKLGLVLLDEFHEVADDSGKGKPFLRCIKSLMNEGVIVVPAGVAELKTVFLNDRQLSTRFLLGHGFLKRISLEVIKALMTHISALNDNQIVDDAVEYVMKETRGVFGHVCDLIEGAFTATGTLSVQALKNERKIMDCLNDLI